MGQVGLGVWNDSLSILSIIYWVVAIPATAIFLFQLANSLIESKSEKARLKVADSSSTVKEIEISFQLISFRNIIGFFTTFGWSGLACIDSGLSITSTIITSVVCGIIMMVVMATILFFMQKLMKTVDEDL